MESSAADNAPRLLVIVPAYNESASIGGVVRDIRENLPDADIVVIDDGSRDDTYRHVPPPARVIRLPFNAGIGAAMQTGYRYAHEHGYDLALQIDGDGQHPAAEARRLVDAIREHEADLVIGSRFLQGSGGYQQTSSRMIGIRLLNRLVRLLSGLTVTDCTSGLRVANRELIDAFNRFYPDDYPEPEVALLAARAGYRVRECPVQMRQRAAGVSSIPLMRGLFYVLKVSLALLLNMLRDPWPHKQTTQGETP